MKIGIGAVAMAAAFSMAGCATSTDPEATGVVASRAALALGQGVSHGRGAAAGGVPLCQAAIAQLAARVDALSAQLSTCEDQLATCTEPPPPPPEGRFALAFDGATHDVYKLNPVGLPAGNAPFTLEAWAQNSGGANGHILTYGNADDNHEDAGLYHYQGQICLWRAGYEDICSGVAWPVDSSFHHVAITWDGSTVAYFLDGALVASRGHSPLDYGPASFLRLGNAYGCCGDRQWLGQIDEVRISDYVRYPASFTPEQTLAADAHTSALFLLDEGAGTTAADASANANNLTLAAPAPTWVAR